MRLVVVICVALTLIRCSSKSNESDRPPVDPALAKVLYAGEVVYLENCARCHRLDSLVKSPIVHGDKKSLLAVHPFDSLTTEEVASVLTFIRNSFGNRGDMITIEEVNNLKNLPVQKQ